MGCQLNCALVGCTAPIFKVASGEANITKRGFLCKKCDFTRKDFLGWGGGLHFGVRLGAVPL